MPTFVACLKGVLLPRPTVELRGAIFTPRGWMIEVSGDQFTARPPESARWQIAEAEAALDAAMSPILSVLSAHAGTTIEFRVDSAEHVDSENPNALVLPTVMVRASAGVVDVLIAGPASQARVVRQAEWAASDPIYRDVLNLLAEARAAPNPRPAASKVVERLQEEVGNLHKVLGVSKTLTYVIDRDQGRFIGDRHARYKGRQPARITAMEREEVLEAVRTLIEAYERATFLGS
jgi:hypothetical protein